MIPAEKIATGESTAAPQAEPVSPAIAAEDVASPRSRFDTAAYRVLTRCAYWSPVLVVLILFAQVSFRGLRPAMAEARRLAAAEIMMGERHDRAAAENRDVAAHLAARQDPIFRERQRRLRVIEPPASSGAEREASEK